jgi:uncharacterized protein YfiM (DUF2279 family)
MAGLNERLDFSLFHLNIYFVHQSWEGDALADVPFASEPGDGPFHAETESAEVSPLRQAETNFFSNLLFNKSS